MIGVLRYVNIYQEEQFVHIIRSFHSSPLTNSKGVLKTYSSPGFQGSIGSGESLPPQDAMPYSSTTSDKGPFKCPVRQRQSVLTGRASISTDLLYYLNIKCIFLVSPRKAVPSGGASGRRLMMFLQMKNIQMKTPSATWWRELSS